jgi:hypothetical protein
MNGKTTLVMVVLMVAVGMMCLFVSSVSAQRQRRDRPPADQGHALKTITLNTGAYAVEPGTDRRSESIVAAEDMHIVTISHFTGVQTGSFPSDNGHVLSLSPENPWEKWADAATGMEPTGTQGYFGYCGRDYYSECAGIQDIMWQELMPADCHVFVPQGATLYMHTYTGNGTGQGRMFHHLARVYYW